MSEADLRLFGSGEVARRLRMPRWKLLYLIDRGDLPGPHLQIAGRRLFTEDDIGRLQDAVSAIASHEQEQGRLPSNPTLAETRRPSPTITCHSDSVRDNHAECQVLPSPSDGAQACDVRCQNPPVTDRS